jgi:hypothetical protein
MPPMGQPAHFGPQRELRQTRAQRGLAAADIGQKKIPGRVDFG